MVQKSPKKRKRKLPKDAFEQDDRYLMECIFGKRIMKAVDKIVDRKSKDDGVDVSIP